ncbi:hypothetical protein AYL99_02088 [Fonsecaea erecta]|uniref:GPI inositol-deacylase n=1 Tax=Fonsecaea erecta TaxID=1367422 RepID=A0A178ZTV2_9EURO|nr:hypothetical protein AYL99_02088 [Fonsecaea erecta]OAP62861.1 hypothetical protein AYL99_02088 [Fonsecaea erecta]
MGKSKQKVENNPRGLTLLYPPAEPKVEFIFVHGLRGGSVKTWCKDEQLDLFWPKEWIATDEDFQHRVRTFSFGYATDWLTSQSSQLTLHDFGRDLLHQLENSPHLRKEQRTPIVLIGHSMGGLVIKKAYLLAHQQRKSIANRIKYVVFLATPHRGSGSAEKLNSLLTLTGWEKAYVEDLRRNSGSLHVINDEFRTVARPDTLRLLSFYETLGSFKSHLIVDQDSAVLGYYGEEVNMLLADHRGICKFDSPQDENYKILRNALLTITESLISEPNQSALQDKAEQMMSIETYLNISHSPQSDLDRLREKQIEQSCAWLEARAEFQAWRDGALGMDAVAEGSLRSRTFQRQSTMPINGRCSIYWLTGKPGAGKSVCAAHVVMHLLSLKQDCSYHFFRAGEKRKTSVSAILLSIAFQMAEIHDNVRKDLVILQEARNTFDEDDEGAVWRKLFVNSILKSHIRQPQYWVIDGVDECATIEKLFLKLHTLESSFDLRIFMTSRRTSKLETLFRKFRPSTHTTVDCIQSDDTQVDMRLYIKSRLDYLPVDDPFERNALIERLLAKANNCFLWLALVSQELEGVYSEESIREVLAEVPLEMGKLYQRSIQSLHASKRQGERNVAKAILIWSACAIRQLKLEELTIALNEYDACKVPNLKAVIEGPCSGLLLLDGKGVIQLVHGTAREYVLGVLESSFEVTRHSAHEQLARACLKCLEKEMVFSRSRSLGVSEHGRTRSRSAFADYASIAFSEHLVASSSQSNQLLKDVCGFLSSRVLAWIEHVATEHPSLYPLTRAAKNLKEFLKRQAKHDPLPGTDFRTVDDWSTDLIRLVAKFGRILRSNPSSIQSNPVGCTQTVAPVPDSPEGSEMARIRRSSF